MTLNELMSLNQFALITVAMGYLGFRIAFAERVNTELTSQVVFLSLCFASVFTASEQLVSLVCENALVSQAASVCFVLGSAVFWRLKGDKLLSDVWRALNVPHMDGQKTALDTIRTSSEFRPATLVVSLRDGTTLFCDDAAAYGDAPFGPCLIAEDGSVALYVTHVSHSKNGEWEEVEPQENDGEVQITVVPADQVRLIETVVKRP